MKKIKTFLFLVLFLFVGDCLLAMKANKKARTVPTKITNVPYDVLGNIFYFLRITKHRNERGVVTTGHDCRLVCKDFKVAFEKHNFDVRRLNLSAELLRREIEEGNLTELYQIPYCTAFLLMIESFFNYVASISEGNYKSYLVINGIEETNLALNCELNNVVSLDLTSRELEGNFLSKFPNLKEFKFYFFRDEDKDDFPIDKSLQHIPSSLEKLDLQSDDSLKFVGAACFPRLDKLEELRLEPNGLLLLSDELELRDGFSKLENLKILHLYSAMDNNIKTFEFLKHFTNLEELSVGGTLIWECSSLNFDLEDCLESLKNLKKLKIYDFKISDSPLSDFCAKTIIKLTKLKSLTLDFITHNSDESRYDYEYDEDLESNLAKGSDSIEELTLFHLATGCGGFLSRFPGLKEICFLDEIYFEELNSDEIYKWEKNLINKLILGVAVFVNGRQINLSENEIDYFSELRRKLNT